LRTVLADDTEVKQLVDFAYPIRSGTAHDGSLHGAEDSLGIGAFSLFEHDRGWMFELFDVGEIRQTSRRVLAKEVQRVAAARR
jgi:hypothetical protein